MAAEAFAPAKINLALHVIGRRDDGYHLMESIVVFADVGDWVKIHAAPDWSLNINGPFAHGLSTTDNLCLSAARLTAGPPAALTLTKNLPVASGIGGGSADAAATLHALRAMDGRALPVDVLHLGADVPVCLAGKPALMKGIGEHLSPLPPLPEAHLCLVNPGIAVSTPQVFAALDSRDNPALPAVTDWPDLPAFTDWLLGTRNDLERPACAIAPVIGTVLDRIADTVGCRLARMSGSGATCFGLYATAENAKSAAEKIKSDYSDWWVTAAAIRA
ncbi:4-diphosphocytidyl-2-C-methyl-D-erythritol kinase [Rhodobacteraceae bacterium THAF1]|uniref:4-(cytidine 5'-diphospho)-2-C-methyl-D-erythritol kinase n=1 Tax=Palleronia sp. THAF1 TaxID=2587842 RepID=UPI000F40C427|nr:4-(cytidine 5'-diphospho)-2-C-methyl-D-erythritol kinase [Palleronia sp. THAF1]QFU09795.1 4-diphosphocytidyl-2-C-methyl-D-erythritol kinase [Palleronia sp. THAF1]VDC17302.1 4-diphosphocytidyl-2-C-methyl-D-erythritol kinase [Rhodobacteraceae bacterium THAF1]